MQHVQYLKNTWTLDGTGLAHRVARHAVSLHWETNMWQPRWTRPPNMSSLAGNRCQNPKCSHRPCFLAKALGSAGWTAAKHPKSVGNVAARRAPIAARHQSSRAAGQHDNGATSQQGALEALNLKANQKPSSVPCSKKSNLCSLPATRGPRKQLSCPRAAVRRPTR